MHALQLYAGAAALKHIRTHGLHAQHIGAVAAAAGGPKGLMLLNLDRFIFGDWLPTSKQPVHLLGASIGAWRMAAVAMPQVQSSINQLEYGYIHETFSTDTPPSPAAISAAFRRQLHQCFNGHVASILNHPRYKLHLFTARGRHILAQATHWRTALGYAGALLANTMHRRWLGAWIERVVFSSPQVASQVALQAAPTPLPFDASDYATQHLALNEANFFQVMQASGSIPFVLQTVQDITGAPSGAYWDGGITDYHLHLSFFQGVARHVAPSDAMPNGSAPIVLYPHFQKNVVAGWLDKHLTWRHRATQALDNVLLLAPNPQWVATLPNGKLPDRQDFKAYLHDQNQRMQLWNTAVRASQQLADEFAQWVETPDISRIQAL